MKKIVLYIALTCSLFVLSSCEEALEVTPKSEFSPSNVLTSEPGIKSLLFSAYAQQQTQSNSRYVINDSEVCTDMGFNTGGAENGQLITLVNFTWDPSIGTFNDDMWTPNYRTIRDANGVIDNIANVNTTDAIKKLYKAEARVLRAQAYALLYSFFGTVPLRTPANQTGDLARSTDDELKAFIETDITQSIADLPDPGKEEAYGRLNKGNANGILAKFYLNTKQWQKAADAAKAVIDLNYYSLNPSFVNLFRVENEGSSNREMMLALQCRPEDPFGNWYQAGALPPAYKSSPQFPAYVYKSTMSNFATQYRLRTAFTSTFAATDKRLQLICTSYVNNSDQTVDLSTGDNARSFKYWDNSTVGNNSGTDVPVIRYADMLLTRAEAINELNGPTTECFSLINQVRTRAGIAILTAADAPTKEAFRTAIFRERGWEFVSEGKRREDLIRQGTFISLALARGITNAKPERVLFPIPQSEIDANKLCVQNPGY
ncbi:RagB/SusD family nutrient uptake outer membrane protein [Spirosoma endbachense]|uniref:RagB/SusD family nutrient uptake outer membrane protein n=1 Tax=Spirosoma endbachense TaxID=2666025 RepID=A0A6P1VXT4_9BACT|nr:RagB/SusD family nutrient uptake outer membrane protein [Spirosoma endbachense]QHV96892.1 RagB/SusD family nutrient uptake outer membrane protein [Spirosoma endbachense]